MKSIEPLTVEKAARQVLELIRECDGKGSGPVPLPTYYGVFYAPPTKLNGVGSEVRKGVKVHRRIVVGKRLPEAFFDKIEDVLLPSNVYMKLEEKIQNRVTVPRSKPSNNFAKRKLA